MAEAIGMPLEDWQESELRVIEGYELDEALVEAFENLNARFSDEDLPVREFGEDPADYVHRVACQRKESGGSYK